MYSVPAEYPADPGEAFEFLKARKRLSVEDIKVLSLLEASGEFFYAGLVAAADNEEARGLLKQNGQEERAHAHRLVKAVKLLSGEDFELPEKAANPYIREAKVDRVSTVLLAYLVKAEVDGDLQYGLWADAEPNSEVAKLYRQNGAEEARHGERVTAIRALLQG